jgi:hypothetical protein
MSAGIEFDLGLKALIGRFTDALDRNTQALQDWRALLAGRPSQGQPFGSYAQPETVAGAPLSHPDSLIFDLRRFLAKATINTTYSVSVGTTSLRVAGRRPQRARITFFNAGSAIIYLGGINVTSGTVGDPNRGLPLQPTTAFSVDANAGEWWAVSGSAAQDLTILEEVTDL